MLAKPPPPPPPYSLAPPPPRARTDPSLARPPPRRPSSRRSTLASSASTSSLGSITSITSIDSMSRPSPSNTATTTSYTATSTPASTSIPVSAESSYGSSSSAVLHPRTSTPLTMRTKHKAVVHEPEMPPQYAHSYFSEDELQTDLDPDPDLDLDTDIDTASHSHADAAHTSRTSHLLRRSSSFSTHQQPSLRARLVALASGRHLPPSSRHQHPRGISTGRGVFCAGETETEGEDLHGHVRHPRRLPTSRIVASSPVVPPSDLQARLTPLLFELSRLLSIVPATFGFLYNLYRLFHPHPSIPPLSATSSAYSPSTSTSTTTEFVSSNYSPTYSHTVAYTPPHPIDHLTALIFCILTAYQCLRLTTGLLSRWRAYYPPLSTLIRLLALQAICWPATHVTLQVLDYRVRPGVVWCVVGTTTCASRAVQMWVTSNLEVPPQPSPPPSSSGARGASTGTSIVGSTSTPAGSPPATSTSTLSLSLTPPPLASSPLPRLEKPVSMTIRSRRRWDWNEVLVQAALPMGVCYFVMAWAEVWRREMERM